MANTIIHKRSSVAGKVPLTSDLEYGELAVNTADSKVFIKDASNVVKAINSWAAVHDKPSGLTTAVSTNTANTIPLRDASGNFAAGTITANLTGNVTGALTGNALTATTLETARLIAGKSFNGSADVELSQLTRGSYLTGSSYNGSAATTWAVDATSDNTASKVVARDASGNFSAGTITAALTGNVTGSASNNVLKAGDTMTGFLTLHADPSNALHAVTKQYVDRLEQGLKAKPAARTATTTNLAATYNNGAAGTGATLTIAAAATLTIGGVSTWSVYDGVLVKNQTNAFENGRYNITQVGNASTNWILTRCALCDNANEIPGAYTFITAGTYKGTGWVQTVDDPSTFTVGTDPITIVQFAGAGEYVGGTGISVVENSISLANAPATTNTANTLVLRDASGNFSAGTITAALTGNASSADKWSTARTITLNGDLTGSVSLDGSQNVTLAATIAANSVELGTDTTGNYVAGATAGNYIVVSGTAGEGWSPTIAVDATSLNTASKVVARDASGNFSAGTITAALTGNASTASALQTARTISLTGDVTGSTSFDGSGNVSIAAVIADNSHNHTIANVDGLQTALDGKSATTHTHSYLPLSGGTMSGGITAPTSIFTGTGNDYFTSGLEVRGNGAANTVFPSIGFHQPSLYAASIQLRSGTEFRFYAQGAGSYADVTAGTFWGTASSARYADLAENYVADSAYEPGTVLEFGGEYEVTLATTAESHRVAGVVSTNPAYLMNSECAGEHVASIALQGRVPCRVQGTVRKGDLLVSAGNGAARAWGFRDGANPITGSVIGKALENNDQAEAIIEVVVGVR